MSGGMRFNETDVAYFGASPSCITHRGWLFKRGELPISTLPTLKLSALYKERWFVLKGNLLFYFKSSSGAHVTAIPTPPGLEPGKQSGIPPYHFRISFTSESSAREYELSAASEEERSQWIKYLATASIELLLNEISFLKQQIKELEPLSDAETPLPHDLQFHRPSTTSLVSRGTTSRDSKRGKRGSFACSEIEKLNRRASNESDSTYGPTMIDNPGSGYSHVLAFTMRVTAALPVSLPQLNVILTKDCFVYLAVQQAVSGTFKTEWVPIRQLSTMTFFKCVPANMGTSMRLSVYLITPDFKQKILHEESVDPNYRQVSISLPLEQLSLCVGELQWTPMSNPLVHQNVAGDVASDGSGQIANVNLTDYQSTSFRQFFQLNGTHLVHEELIESKWAFIVPKLLLQAWIDYEKKLIADFTTLSPLGADIHVTRLRQLDVHKQLLAHYQDELVALEDLPLDVTLRKSVDKTTASLQMVALNCVVQRLHLTDARYSVVTFGAPTAHALGYSIVPPAEADVVVAYHALQASSQQAARLRNLLCAFQDAVSALQRVSMPPLSSVVGGMAPSFPKMAQACVPPVLKAAKEIAAHVDMIRHSLRDLDAAVLDGFQAQFHNVTADLMEDLIPLLAVRSKVLAAQPTGDAFAAFSEALAATTEHVQLAHDGALALLEHHRLLLDAKFAGPSSWQVVRRRQDCTFSQCLGAVVTGLEETVRGWLEYDCMELWALWTHVGWLAQFESLLTAHGDELTMLLDMKAALFDVENTVQFALHPVEEDNFASTNVSAGEKSTADSYLPESMSSNDSQGLPMLQSHSRAPLNVKILGERGNLTVSLGIARQRWETTPRHEYKVQMRSLLFTQGINEQQILPSVFGGGKSQDMINRQSYEKLRHHVSVYRDHVLKATRAHACLHMRSFLDYVDMLVSHFDQIIQGSEIKVSGMMSSVGLETKENALSGGASPGMAATAASGLRKVLGAVSTAAGRTKNTDVLVMAAHITRVLGGHYQAASDTAVGGGSDTGSVATNGVLPPFGKHPTATTRFTSCKSAKDRTSMSVTLEQCFELQASHGLSVAEFEGLLSAMRACGTRIRNVQRNVGKPAYAFNVLTWNVLPRLYRPPQYTIRNNVET